MTFDEWTLESPNFHYETVADGAMTSGVATLTSATIGFTTADVGRSVTVSGAGVAGATLTTTVSAYIGVTQVTLALAASTTVSNATVVLFSGTMIRLMVDTWGSKITDANPAEVAVGDGEAPIKINANMFLERWVVVGKLTTNSATDTTIWNPTIVADVSRTALSNVWEYRDLLDTAMKTWGGESGTGNWHNDGAQARGTGVCRMRVGYKNSGGSAVAKYVYGSIVGVDFGPVAASMKDSGSIPFRLEFAYAQVESTA